MVEDHSNQRLVSSCHAQEETALVHVPKYDGRKDSTSEEANKETKRRTKRKCRVPQNREWEASAKIQSGEVAFDVRGRTKASKKDIKEAEMTLWDLVMKNGRTTSLRKETQQKTGGHDVVVTTEEKDVDSLGFLVSKSQEAPKESSSNSPDTLQDLFGPTDNLLSPSLKFNERSQLAASGFRKDGLHNSGSLRLDQDGNLLLDESTCFGKNDLFSSAFLTEGRTVVSENFTEPRIIQPYSEAYRHSKAVKWEKKDEDTFYEALETFGLDLMMVSTWLPLFSARQIKDKYHIEEKRNGKRIEDALQKRRPITVNQFELLHGEIDESTHFRPVDDLDNHLILEDEDANNSALSISRSGSFFDGLFEEQKVLTTPHSSQHNTGFREFSLETQMLF